MQKGSDVDQIVLLYTTWPDAETAEATAAEAVAERLCACVNILGSARSIYRWQGSVERAVETVAVFKTQAGCVDRLSQLIVDRHPYDTPAIVALPVSPGGSNPAYLAWIAEETA
jgi:periplasmic divalent cation tolerance protein